MPPTDGYNGVPITTVSAGGRNVHAVPITQGEANEIYVEDGDVTGEIQILTGNRGHIPPNTTQSLEDAVGIFQVFGNANPYANS